MASYGTRASSKFKLPSVEKDETYYTLVDSKTGTIFLKRINKLVPDSPIPGASEALDATVGTIEASGTNKGKFIPSAGATPTEKLAFAQQPQSVSAVKSQAEITSNKAQIKSGVDAQTASTRSKELLENGKATTPPNAGDTSVPADTVTDTGSTFSGTQTTGFGNFTYPSNLRSIKQDVIRFTMLEYKPSGLGKGKGVSGGQNILQIGGGRGSDKDWATNRKIAGTVTLPIPSGISDTNAVDWGENNMNALQAALAAGALTGIKEGLGSMFGALGDTFSQTMNQDGENATNLASSAFAATAVGGDATAILSRAEGIVVNPNMELLFNGPQLRPFNFTFKMSARNSAEAQQIIKIINFFKRGMSPIKTESNLFLKAPNTFKVQYLLRNESEDHPYIGRIKECALQNITVNYTPDGQYATYQDGVMISYEMTLQLKELEPIFNSDYEGLEGIGY